MAEERIWLSKSSVKKDYAVDMQFSGVQISRECGDIESCSINIAPKRIIFLHPTNMKMTLNEQNHSCVYLSLSS